MNSWGIIVCTVVVGIPVFALVNAVLTQRRRAAGKKNLKSYVLWLIRQ